VGKTVSPPQTKRTSRAAAKRRRNRRNRRARKQALKRLSTTTQASPLFPSPSYSPISNPSPDRSPESPPPFSPSTFNSIAEPLAWFRRPTPPPIEFPPPTPEEAENFVNHLSMETIEEMADLFSLLPNLDEEEREE
jgi:hypothetical protein